MRLLTSLDTWIFFPLTLVFVVVGLLVGRALGARLRAGDEVNAEHMPAVQGALLGLLSLMIGFTLSLSLSRYQARQTAVMHETQAVESAMDRATLLPPQDAAPAKLLLSHYLEQRIALGAPGERPDARTLEIERSRQLQDQLWTLARDAVGLDSRSVAASLFVQALDGMGDASQERLAADRTGLPQAVFVGLYSLAVIAFGYLGFVNGVKGSRHAISNALMATAFVAVITLVADLDRPEAGLVNVSQRSLMELAGTPHPP